ncbi:MAG: hypothetical protein IJD28_02210 [Deferribacterales bacterium]|nr:hypothetical protein [Deferribacterales bacterium]
MRRKLSVIFIFCFLFPYGAFAQEEAVKETESKAVEVKEEKLIDVQGLIKELREKEKALNTREADLNAREARLDALEKEILNRESELKKLRNDVTKRIDELKGAENSELDKLAKMYSSAKPKSAAAILVQMDIEKAVSIFRRMTPSAAGKVLNEMGKLNPLYASKLSESLTPQPISDAQ